MATSLPSAARVRHGAVRFSATRSAMTQTMNWTAYRLPCILPPPYSVFLDSARDTIPARYRNRSPARPHCTNLPPSTGPLRAKRLSVFTRIEKSRDPRLVSCCGHWRLPKFSRSDRPACVGKQGRFSTADGSRNPHDSAKDIGRLYETSHPASHSESLDSGGHHRFDRMAFLREHPQRTVLIEGYTDSRGSDAYNLSLSERRAEAVQDFLLENGISPDRVRARGYGKAYPWHPTPPKRDACKTGEWRS